VSDDRGQWEKYVEQAARVAYESGGPVWSWDRLSAGERAPRLARMRAALSAVGPSIAEDTRERMVAAAGRAVERDCAAPPAAQPDRAQYDGDGDHLDEVVIHNATVHIEAMDTHNFMIMITRPAGPEPYEVYAHFNAQNLTETDEMEGVPYEIHEPLLYHYEWRDERNVLHQCIVNHPDPERGLHRCCCGRQQRFGSTRH
jgi:hypothetical protein